MDVLVVVELWSVDDIETIHIIKFLKRAGDEVVDIAKDIAPYKTGNLKKDIQVFDDHIDQLEVSIGNSLLAQYAPFVHFGTKPHKITNAWGRGITVNHPGQKAQPYLDDALDRYLTSGGIERNLDDLGEHISEDLWKSIKKGFE